MSELGSMGEGEMEQEEFDEVLAKALRRVEAPEGFAAKVMEMASVAPESVTAPKGKLLMMPRVQAWMGGAIAAALVMGALIGARVHVVRQQEQAALTERQFEAAMRVTNRALDQTQMQLQRAGLKLGE
jgi:hypothetical protein